jgi:integrase/recombinase XerD
LLVVVLVDEMIKPLPGRRTTVPVIETSWRSKSTSDQRSAQASPRRAPVASMNATKSGRSRLMAGVGDGASRAAPRRGVRVAPRDVHLLADSRALGCEVARAHLHMVRREDNPNRV